MTSEQKTRLETAPFRRGHHCCYCGWRYEALDHVVPFSWTTKSWKKRNGAHTKYSPGETVYACHKCNATLSDKIFGRGTIEKLVRKRAAYLLQRYEGSRRHFKFKALRIANLMSVAYGGRAT